MVKTLSEPFNTGSERSFYNFIFRPEKAWDGFSARLSPSSAFLIFIAAQTSQAIAFGVFNGSFIIMLPVFVFQWIITASVYHLLSNISGGRGNAVSFLYLWAMTEIPMLFLPAVRVLNISAFGGGALTAFALFAAVYVWSAVLKVKLLKFNYHLPAYAALFVLVEPFIIAGVLTAAAFAVYAVYIFL